MFDCINHACRTTHVHLIDLCLISDNHGVLEKLHEANKEKIPPHDPKERHPDDKYDEHDPKTHRHYMRKDDHSHLHHDHGNKVVS